MKRAKQVTDIINIVKTSPEPKHITEKAMRKESMLRKSMDE